MDKVEVNKERLVRLQREIERAQSMVIPSPFRARNILAKLREEVDAILLGEPAEREKER